MMNVIFRQSAGCFFVLLIFYNTVCAQEQSKWLSRRIRGVQAGILGAWVYQENRVGVKKTIRYEAGFDYLFYGAWETAATHVVVPSLSIEPRWYYNIKKRSSRSKKTERNSADYLSVLCKYRPGELVTSNKPVGKSVSSLGFMPSFGIRRSIGKRMNFEFALGWGYGFVFADKAVGEAFFGNFALRLGIALPDRKKSGNSF